VFSQRRAVEPDLFVVPLVDGRKPRHLSDVRRLVLAVEVSSPSTARTDRVEKRTLYREEGVDEYWIVDLDSRIFERSTPSEPRPEILDTRLEWRPEGATTALTIDLIEYFEKVLDA
jgi:Uma2 family endonuclease